MELQGERDNVQKDIEDFKSDTNKYMAEMNKRINTGKTDHDQLTREVRLVRQIYDPFRQGVSQFT